MKMAFALFFLYMTPLLAEAQPPWAKESNCQTPKICYEIDQALDACKNNRKKACDQFVNLYKEALSSSGCPETANNVDKRPTITWCGGHERYLDFLSKMKSKRARRLFGSPELRKTLDGDLAETYLKASMVAGQEK